MSTRRRFTREFKAKVASEALHRDKTNQEIAVRHKVHPNQVGALKQRAVESVKEVFSKGAAVAHLLPIAAAQPPWLSTHTPATMRTAASPSRRVTASRALRVKWDITNVINGEMRQMGATRTAGASSSAL